MSVIKMTNDVMLSAKSSEIHTVDLSNVLVRMTSASMTWTATKDCYIFFDTSDDLIQIDGLCPDDSILCARKGSKRTRIIYPVKKGQVVNHLHYNDGSFSYGIVYGLK